MASYSIQNLTGKDAASRPHIDGGCVDPGTKQDVGRPVPQGHDLGGEAAHRNAKRPRQSKVGQFQLPILNADCDMGKIK